MNNSREAGFTLVELLYSLMIVGILITLGFVAVKVYANNAHYVMAESDMHHARIAIQRGDLDSNAGDNYAGWVESGAELGELEPILPGMVTSEDVRMGVIYNNCSAGVEPHMSLTVQPCKGDKYLRWTKFCSGIEVPDTELAKDYNCGG